MRRELKRQTKVQSKRRRFFLGAALIGIGLGLPLMTPAPVLAQFGDNARLFDERVFHFDLFAGKNKPGPYTLTWNNFKVDADYPVRVIVDGTELKPGEYTLDPAKGLITFSRPLGDKSMARIAYYYEPKVAKRNANPTNSPLTLPVTRLGSTNVQVTALPNTGDPNKGTTSTPLVWGAGGKMKLLGGGVDSEFKYAGEEKTGVRLGFNRGNSQNGLNLNYVRNQKEFATTYGKSLGMGDAIQQRNLVANLTPSKYLGTTYSSREDINFLKNEEKAQEVYGVRLGGVGKQPVLNFTRTEDTAIAPNKDETNVTTEKIDLTARLDHRTTINATTVQTDTNVPNPQADATARDTTVTLTSVANKGAKQATATLNQGTREVKAALEERRGLQVRLQPAPVFIVTAGHAEQTVTPVAPDGKTGDPTRVLTQTAGAELVPMPGTKFTGSVAETIHNDVKVSTTNFTAALTPNKQLEITAATTNRASEVEGQNPLDTTTTRVALRPMNNVTLTGTYIWNPEANGVVRQEYRKEFGFSATAKRMEVSASTVNRDTPVGGLSDLDTTITRFALRPTNYLTLTGTYVWNPEDKGVIKEEQRKELGLKATFGTVEVGSVYTLTTLNSLETPDDLNPQFGQVSFTLGMRFNRWTRLNGTYLDSLRYRSADEVNSPLIPRYLRTYGLGLTHDIGPGFNFSVGGNITEDRSRAQQDQTEKKAEAKIGVRF